MVAFFVVHQAFFQLFSQQPMPTANSQQPTANANSSLTERLKKILLCADFFVYLHFETIKTNDYAQSLALYNG